MSSEECRIDGRGCQDPHGSLIQLCPNCKGMSCKSCSDEWIHLRGFQCTTCKVPIPRLKYFYAGKIGGYDSGDVCPRILITLDDKTDSGNDLRDFKNLEKPLAYSEGVKNITTGPYQIGYAFCCVCGGGNVDTDDIGNETCMGCGQRHDSDDHGFGFDTANIRECLNDIRVLNQRNREMIHSCDIFSLCINRHFDCQRSIAEWGIASGQNKTLLIYFEKYLGGIRAVDFSKFEEEYEGEWEGWSEIYDGLKCDANISRGGGDARQCSNNKCGARNPMRPRNFCKKHQDEYDNLKQLDKKQEAKRVSDHCLKCAEFYTFIQDCLDSLQGLDDRMKEFVIYCHPVLSKRFGGYKDYKKYLEDIFQLKK